MNEHKLNRYAQYVMRMLLEKKKIIMNLLNLNYADGYKKVVCKYIIIYIYIYIINSFIILVSLSCL